MAAIDASGASLIVLLRKVPGGRPLPEIVDELRCRDSHPVDKQCAATMVRNHRLELHVGSAMQAKALHRSPNVVNLDRGVRPLMAAVIVSPSH